MCKRLWQPVHRLAWLTVFSVLVGVTPVGAAAIGSISPQETVVKITEEFVSALIKDAVAVKQDPMRGVQLAHTLLVPHLDFERFSRWVLGKHWRSATPEQRIRFVTEFTQSLVMTYATAMTSFVDEIISLSKSVIYPPARYRNGDTEAMVPMRIRLATGGEAEVRYRLHLNEDRWMIYDVTVQGVSLATTYRMSYNTLIQEKGLDGLLEYIETRNRSRRYPCPSAISKCGSSGQDKSNSGL
ncbi:MAG: ABC transporter substrate-binding protein [Gammaproteobacteria bacterium]|nr:ABC transporter substrate-binding protein [Gammaproteobacteria bacterium]